MSGVVVGSANILLRDDVIALSTTTTTKSTTATKKSPFAQQHFSQRQIQLTSTLLLLRQCVLLTVTVIMLKPQNSS